ncbi:MAG: riboflavin synthase [Verrucomicrobia bacterium]|nr:MAG: riboflavin synthase [Verrucomicrobiota bacterium]
MFSGIVEKMGVLKLSKLEHKWGRIGVQASGWEDEVQTGDSIAVQGICLTIAAKEGDVLYFDVLKETFERTTLGDKHPGDRLNLERALRWGQPMGGHIVIGHVDGVGEIRAVRPAGRDRIFEIAAPEELLDGLVYKGSVAVDGVSLTVAELGADSFCVHIIPYTMENTTFGGLRAGDRVNLEVDVLAKYVRRLIERGRVPWHIEWDELRRIGLIQDEIVEGDVGKDRDR